MATACVLCKPNAEGLEGLDDSKRLSARRRAALEPVIRRNCAFAIATVEAAEIDRLNVFGATMRAMTRAMTALAARVGRDPDAILIDGNMTPVGRDAEWRWTAKAIVGGDALEPAISAASILAKEHRDRIMRAAARAYPAYGWETNMGYPTREHLAALREHGPTPLHRRSFAPVAQALLL